MARDRAVSSSLCGHDADTPIGLLLTMADGSEVRLTASRGVREQRDAAL